MRHQFLLAILIALFLAIGTIYSITTPIFEASDELWHYPVVKHIADGKGLPVQDPALASPWQQEGSQPPLYYALAALATFWIDTDDLATLLYYNPHARIGDPLADGNKNLVVHTERERFPWQGAVLAIHIIRLGSVLLQATTVVLTYLLAQAVAPNRPAVALAAASLVAFNPMFLFIAGSVNNDNLIVPLTTFILWRLVVIWRNGWPARWDIPILGIALGLAALTKLSGLVFCALAAIVLTALAVRRQSWRAWFGWGALLVAEVVIIAGWWYARNWQLYGDPTGLNMMLEIAGRRPATFGIRDLLGEFEGFWLSYWGVFGGFNVIAPRWVYRLYEVLLVAAAVGWVWRAGRGWRAGERPNMGSVLILVTAIGLVAIALVRWTSQTYASQGRLLFPVISAVAVLAVIGLSGWLPRNKSATWLAGLAIILAGLAIAIPFAVIAPAYAKPPILRLEQVSTDIRPVNLHFAGIVRVIGYEIPQETVKPGERLGVTVYWEVLAATDRDLTAFVHVRGRERTLVGQMDTYLGKGAYPFSLLSPGDVIKDTYTIPIHPTASAPTRLQIEVGLFDRQASVNPSFAASDADGQPADQVIATARLLPVRAPEFTVDTPLNYDLNGQVRLIGYALSHTRAYPGDTIILTLYWQPQTRMSEDFQVFVHLDGPDGVTAAQGDKAPLDNDWPSSAWEPGLPFRDEYPIALPADLPVGSYDLRVGLYRLTDGWRLPVSGADGRLPNAAVTLAELEIQ